MKDSGASFLCCSVTQERSENWGGNSILDQRQKTLKRIGYNFVFGGCRIE